MTLGERIKELRIKKGLTQKDIADQLGMGRSNFGHIENDRITPSSDDLQKIADILETSTDYLLGRKSDSFPDQVVVKEQTLNYLTKKSEEVIRRMLEEFQQKEATQDVSLVRIPILGTIKAGYDLYAEQQVIGYSMIAKEEVADGEYFYLLVKGDSMTGDRINEGDRVLVRRQDWVEEGKIAVVLVNGEEATLKRVYPQDNMVILQSSNPAYPPKICPADEVRIQGQVVKVEFDI